MSGGVRTGEKGIIDPQVVLLDIAFFVFFLLYTFIIIVFRESVVAWAIALRDLVIAAVVVGVSSIVIRHRGENTRAILRGLLVVAACGLLFKVAEQTQHAFIGGWLDEQIISLDHALWGMETSGALQQFVHPLLTEWMMFAYVVYIPLIPFTLFVVSGSGGEKGIHDYLLNLSLSYLLCYVGFMLYPLATQMHHDPGMYTVPLEGWFFTWCGEWMRMNVHAPGAALPSPHCAAATVILVMFHRYHRRLFYVVLPVILTLYAATVYCRYHYLWDSIAGILTAVVVLTASPKLVQSIAARSRRPIVR
ncbi:MAG: superfamily protein [Bacteroidetes bacterium]|nr:superfamily protein [Bacteroidota bacterium]